MNSAWPFPKERPNIDDLATTQYQEKCSNRSKNGLARSLAEWMRMASKESQVFLMERPIDIAHSGKFPFARPLHYDAWEQSN